MVLDISQLPYKVKERESKNYFEQKKNETYPSLKNILRVPWNPVSTRTMKYVKNFTQGFLYIFFYIKNEKNVETTFIKKVKNILRGS